MTCELAWFLRVPQIDLQEPIRVLFVSHDSSMWGAQRTLLTLLSAMDRRICSPLLLAPYEGPMTRAATELGIPVFVERLVHWIPGYFLSTKEQRVRHLYHFIRTLHARSRTVERLIADYGIDLVYTNTVTCVEGAIAAWRTRKPHVWHIHEHIRRNRELTRMFPYRVYCGAIGILSRSIIFPSRWLAREYPQLSRKASVIYNGLPFPPLRNRMMASAEARSALGVDRDSKLVALVGALNPRKDHLTFLAAAEKVAQRIERVSFLIVGSGWQAYTNVIRQRIVNLRLDSRVRLVPWWQGDIYDLMAAIDVLVISSEQEPFGLTAIEALAMETPVVATRCGGPEEIMEDGVTGILVPVKDYCAIAEAIVKLLLDPKLASRLGIRGRKHVLERFSVDRYVQGIQRIIQETGSSCRNR